MNIDELFGKYPENIFGFRLNQSIKIIDFWIPNAWELVEKPDLYSIKKQKIDEENNRSYYIIFSDNLSFESLFSHVSSLIEYNLDIEKKQTLFKEKITELKKLFTSLSYEELKELHFDPPLTLPPDPPKKKVLGAEKENNEEIINEVN